MGAVIDHGEVGHAFVDFIFAVCRRHVAHLRFASSTSSGLTPQQIRHAYGFDQVALGTVAGDGSGQTIAILDPFESPTIAGDLQAFDAQFGLPDPPSFVRVAQDGSTNYPVTDPSRGLGCDEQIGWRGSWRGARVPSEAHRRSREPVQETGSPTPQSPTSAVPADSLSVDWQSVLGAASYAAYAEPDVPTISSTTGKRNVWLSASRFKSDDLNPTAPFQSQIPGFGDVRGKTDLPPDYVPGAMRVGDGEPAASAAAGETLHSHW